MCSFASPPGLSISHSIATWLTTRYPLPVSPLPTDLNLILHVDCDLPRIAAYRCCIRRHSPAPRVVIVIPSPSNSMTLHLTATKETSAKTKSKAPAASAGAINLGAPFGKWPELLSPYGSAIAHAQTRSRPPTPSAMTSPLSSAASARLLTRSTFVSVSQASEHSLAAGRSARSLA